MKVNRRDTLKTLLIGSIGAGMIGASGCKTDEKKPEEEVNPPSKHYGRTEDEKLRDKMLEAQPPFFSEGELLSLGALIDIILPADDISGSASDAGVLDFISFIVKDMKSHQAPLRSGLGWLNRESMARFDQSFNNLPESNMISIIDDVAYPEETKNEHKPGENFFSLLRNLTLTGFYTSQIGIKDIGYMGNRPNFWDGVPDDVLKKHGLSHDKKYQDKYITQEKSIEVAKWDDNGNLI